VKVILGIQKVDTWLWFTQDQSVVPPGPLCWQWLADVGAIRKAARASYLGGIGETEAPNVQVSLNNRGNQASSLIGALLRRRVEIRSDSGEILFSGVVTRVRYGTELSLDIEA
jgi:hypothetical protein